MGTLAFQSKPLAAEQYLEGQSLPAGVCVEEHEPFGKRPHVHVRAGATLVGIEPGDWVVQNSRGYDVAPGAVVSKDFTVVTVSVVVSPPGQGK